MLRKTFLILLCLLLCTPAIGCAGKKATESEEPFGEHLAFDFGGLETLDLDGDGYEDRFTYTFEKEEVDEDLFLQKTVEYEKTEAGFMGELTLEFENTGDETKTYSHIEIIPKSFAESVDDLEFSIPPDEIISPDPTVRWEVAVIKDTVVKLVAKVKKAAEEVGKKKGMEAAEPSGEEAKKLATESFAEIGKAIKGEEADWGKALLGLGRAGVTGLEALKKGKEVGVEAGMEAAIDAIFGSLDDFAFIAAVNRCGQQKDSKIKDKCVLQLIARFGDKFKESILWDDTTKLCFELITNEEYYLIPCVVLAGDDISLCDKFEDENDRTRCKWEVITAKCCVSCDEPTLEECAINKIVELGDESLCERFQDKDVREFCLMMLGKEGKEGVVQKEGAVQATELPPFNYGNIRVNFDATFKDVETGEEHFSSAQSVSFGPPEGQYDGTTSGSGFTISWTETGDDEDYPDNPLYSYVVEGNISVTIDPKTHDVTGFNAKSTLTYGSGASFNYAVSGGHCSKSSEGSEWLTCSHSVDEGGWTPQITWSEVPGDPEGPGFATYDLLKADYRNTIIEFEVREPSE